MMPPSMRDEMMGWFMEMLKGPTGFSGLRSQSNDANGRLVYLETSGVPIFDDNRTLLGYRGITRDITELVGRRGQDEAPLSRRDPMGPP